MEKKMIAVSELITHEYSIEQYQNLFSIMSEKSDGIIRGVFKF
jgi:threonine dehydrogenase-like Zn-dependent dehydrogenase